MQAPPHFFTCLGFALLGRPRLGTSSAFEEDQTAGRGLKQNAHGQQDPVHATRNSATMVDIREKAADGVKGSAQVPGMIARGIVAVAVLPRFLVIVVGMNRLLVFVSCGQVSQAY
jgi:hypothetical protein